MQSLFILFISLLSFFPQHKFYLSLTEVRYSENENSLQIAVKLFSDDLDAAIKNQSGKEIDIANTKGAKINNPLIGDYIIKHLRVKQNGKPLEMHYLGAELQLDATWAYIEIDKVKNLNHISIENSLFLEMFSEQNNIINFIYKGETKSFIGDQKDQVFNVELN